MRRGVRERIRSEHPTQHTMKTKYEQQNFKVGCYIDESSGSADDCNTRIVEFAMEYGFKPGHAWRKSEYLNEIADDAVTFLNDKEDREFMFWTIEDNSLFLMANVESAREEVEFVSSKDQEHPADGFRGLWLHVSDHGNATLYLRQQNGQDREMWSVV